MPVEYYRGILLGRGQQRHESRAGPGQVSLRESEFLVPLDVGTAFRPRDPLDHFLDDRNLPNHGRMRIRLVKERRVRIAVSSGFVTLHDFLHVDEYQPRLRGKEMPQAVVVAAGGLEWHVRRRLFRVDPGFVGVTDDDQLHALVAQSTRQGDIAFLERRHGGGAHLGRHVAAKKEPSVRADIDLARGMEQRVIDLIFRADQQIAQPHPIVKPFIELRGERAILARDQAQRWKRAGRPPLLERVGEADDRIECQRERNDQA